MPPSSPRPPSAAQVMQQLSETQSKAEQRELETYNKKGGEGDMEAERRKVQVGLPHIQPLATST